MKRVFSYLKFVAIPFVLTTMAFGQEQDDTEKRPVQGTLGKESNSDTGDKNLIDIPVALLPKTAEELGKVLEKTERINVVCGEYQVIFPLPNDVKPFPFAESFLQFCEFLPDTKIHQGKSSLLIEPRPVQEIQVLRTTTKLLFGFNPDRKWFTRSAANTHESIAPDGLPATKVLPEVATMGRILENVESISISLGAYNIIVPVSGRPLSGRMAQRIVDLTQTHPELVVLDARKSLFIETPLQIAPDLVVALAEELLAVTTDEMTRKVTESEAEGRSDDDFLVDSPVLDVFADAVSIESILKETKAISIRFGGHQITMRILPSEVDDQRVNVLAEVIQSFREAKNEAASRSSNGFGLKLGNKRTALLVSMPPNETPVEFVRAIIGTLFSGQTSLPNDVDPTKTRDSSSTRGQTTGNSKRDVARINLGMRNGKRNSECDMIVFYSQESDTEKLFAGITERINSNIYLSKPKLRLASSNGGLLLSCPVSLAVAVTKEITESLQEEAVDRAAVVPPQKGEVLDEEETFGSKDKRRETNSLHATLLILKADFKSPTSDELKTEMEAEFGKLHLNERLQQAFKATNIKSVTGALFPPQTVTCYTPEHATSLLRWLVKHQLIVTCDVGMPGVFRDSGGKGVSTPILKEGLVISDYKRLLPIDTHLAPNLGPFVKFTQQFYWFLQMIDAEGSTKFQSTIFISTNEQQPRGQSLNTLKMHGKGRFELPAGMVAFVSGFARGTEHGEDTNRGSLENLQVFARQRGFEPVIVIFRGQGLFDVPAAFHVPDLVKSLTGSSTFGIDRDRSDNQIELASQVFDRRQVLLGIENTEIPVEMMPTSEGVVTQDKVIVRPSTETSVNKTRPSSSAGKHPASVPRNVIRKPEQTVASGQAESLIDELGQPIVSSPRTSSVNDLKQRCEAKENSTIELAHRIQSNPGRAGDDEADLRRAVAEAFDLRQQLHRAELAEFQQRMETIRKKVQTREQNKDQMIKRRIEDLLNPNLKWDLSTVRRQGNQESASNLSALKIKSRESLADANEHLQAQIASLERYRDDVLRSREESDRLRNLTTNESKKRSDWPVPFRKAADVESLKTNDADPFVDIHTEDNKLHTVARLEKLSAALQGYEKQMGRFPSAAGPGLAGQGTLPISWRVKILPFLGEGTLYNKYNFDEPWDSKRNLEILKSMPRVFRSPLDSADSTNTSYFGFVTPEYQPDSNGKDLNPYADKAKGSPAPNSELTFFSNPIGTAIHEITDGPTNTIAIIEAKRATPWTKPDDIAYSLDKPFPVMERWFPDGWHVAFADGTVRQISSKIDDSRLRALVTIDGGEVCKPMFVEEPK